jgi:ankyrin repeat protein
MTEGNSKIPNSKTNVCEFLNLWKSLNDAKQRTLLFNMLEGDIVDKLHNLAIQGVDLIHCDKDGSNLLHHAAYSDNPDVIKFLIYLGCEVDGKDDKGMTPIHIASANGNIHSLKILLEHSKHWLIKNKSGKTFIGVAYKDSLLKIYILIISTFFKKRIFK